MPFDEDPVISTAIVGVGIPVMVDHSEIHNPSYNPLAYVPPPSAMVFPGEDRKPASQMIEPLTIAPMDFQNLAEEEKKEEE